MDHAKIWELLCVRRILDYEAARLACRHATRKDLDGLRRVYDRAVAIGEDRVLHDVQEGGKLYTEFFNALLASTKNTLFMHIRKSVNSILIGALPYSRKKLSSIEGSSRTIVNQLHAIYGAIEARNADMASAAIVEHIDYLKKSLKKALAVS